MRKLEFSKPEVNLIRTEVKVGIKDWPYLVGTIGYWAGRGCEFSYQTPEFFCLLTAEELREIADKMDELKPAEETLQVGQECSDITAQLSDYEVGFDPRTIKPKHVSDIEDEMAIIKDKMGRPYIATYDPDDNKWRCINSGFELETDAIERWSPLPLWFDR
jgi:NTP pyrophosphatase (non-canonical NTP hydrolase)